MSIVEKNRGIFRHCPECGCVAMRPEGDKALLCTACGFIFYLNASTAVAALIADADGRLLVTVRAGEPHQGMLDLPGGFVDPGERAEEALAREVREELGLDVTAMEYLGSSTNEYLYRGVTYPTTDLAFRCTVAPGADIVPDDDVGDCHWLPPDEVEPGRLCSDSMREFVRRFFVGEEPAGQVHTAGYPILEFDPERQAMIEPSRVQRAVDVPEHCLVCFFHEVVGMLTEHHPSRVAHVIHSEMGEHPVYELDWHGHPLALVHPGIGGPLAGATLEELVAMGCRKFMACGGAGALRPDLVVGHVVVPTTAVRDEGTSYHYLPPGEEAIVSPEALAVIEAVLAEEEVPYVTGPTWTTDAIYRETPARVARRRDQGCLTVEMEAAAFFAVAQFRGVALGQLLYAADDLSGEEWDHRDWQKQRGVRERVAELAAEACLRL